jgi:hypothetical protein
VLKDLPIDWKAKYGFPLPAFAGLSLAGITNTERRTTDEYRIS